jgi:hypothetical protein
LNDGDTSHGSGNFQEQPYPFTVNPSKIGVRTEFFGLRKDWEPVDIFMNMFGIPSVCGKANELIDRIVTSTKEYMNERWKFERGQPPARKVDGRPEGARVGPLADRGRYVRQAELLSFLGQEFSDGLSSFVRA